MSGSAFSTAVAITLLASYNAQPSDLTNNSQTASAQMSGTGDRMFREARFEEAETAYSRALDLDPTNVRGHLGMGRIATLLSDSRRASEHYSAAYQLAPRDPDTILAFADVVENTAARQTLLRNFLVVAHDARLDDVKARLQVAQRIGSGPLASLESPYQTYNIPLSAARAGLLLRAAINGKELKLVVDTGASGIVLNASAASLMDLEFLADAALLGYGSAAPAAAKVARAASFEAAGLKIGNVLLQVSQTDLSRDADGWIGLDVFREFLIRLDPRRRTLELTPFPQQAATACGGCVRAYKLGSLLLVRATVNGQTAGYFILDSGSPYSIVSRKLIASAGATATFYGAQGAQNVFVPWGAITLRLGQRRFEGFRYAVLDTAEISARNGTEIAGAIGYSVLRDLEWTVDYRNGFVRLATSGGK